ncbi:MAG: LamG domain-containing protein, partial [bacterium]|nr:LamG domain-containing protein [bacterium]
MRDKSATFPVVFLALALLFGGRGGPWLLAAGEPTSGYIVQGKTVEQVAAAVESVGGEVTHRLAIIAAVGARLTEGQVEALGNHEDVERVYEDRRVDTDSAAQRDHSGLVALYDFSEDPGSSSIVRDVAGTSGSPLDLTIEDPERASWSEADGLELTEATRASNSTDSNQIFSDCTASNELTVEAWIEPGNTTQGGPARIVTLSLDSGQRNFSLTQDGSRYQFRLRTTTNGNNGTNVRLFSAVGSVTTSLQHLVATRASSGEAALYLNGEQVDTETIGGGFANWNPAYDLALGNEFSTGSTTTARDWVGNYRLVGVYCEAHTSSQVAANFAAGPDLPTQNETATPAPRTSAVVLYDFSEGSGANVRDLAAATPADLTIEDLDRVSWSGGGLTLEQATRVSNTVDAAKIFESCASSNELTVEAWVTPGALSQGGPARIVSLSKDSGNRNFSLLQDGDRYQFRLRTTSNGNNGTYVLLRSAPSSVEFGLQQLVVTRDAFGSASLYLDGVQVDSQTIGGSFANWNASYGLALGNEFNTDSTTTSRDWVGSYSLVAVYCEAHTPSQVAANFAAGPVAPTGVAAPPAPTPPIPTPAPRASPVVLYDFSDGAGISVSDLAAGTPVDLAIEDPDRVSWSGGGLNLEQATRVS